MFDKIDYLFKRGKNADERCYDFFIRTVTFLLITLIVLCYGSFVHADGSFPVALGIDYLNQNLLKLNHKYHLKYKNMIHP